MKLRIAKNSIRIRLSESEAADWARLGRLEESVELAENSRLVYALERDRFATDIVATFQSGLLRVIVPERMAAEWLASGEEGISSDRIFIERDLSCKHARSTITPELR